MTFPGELNVWLSIKEYRDGKEPVSHNKDTKIAIEEAKSRGATIPFILYIDDPRDSDIPILWVLTCKDCGVKMGIAVVGSVGVQHEFLSAAYCQKCALPRLLESYSATKGAPKILQALRDAYGLTEEDMA